MRKAILICALTLMLGGFSALSVAGTEGWRWSLVYFARGDDATYGKMLDRAIEGTGQDDDIYNLLHLQRGLYHRYMGDFAKSQEDLWIAYKSSKYSEDPSQVVQDPVLRTKSSQYEPEKRELCFLHFYMALNETMLGEYDRALIEIKKTEWIGEHENSLPEVSFLRSVIEFQLGGYDEAAVAIRRCLAKSPNFAAAYLMLAKILERVPALSQGGEDVDSMLDRYAELAGGYRPSTSDRLLLVEVVQLNRNDTLFERLAQKNNANFAFDGAASAAGISLPGATLGTMAPGKVAGEERRAKTKKGLVKTADVLLGAVLPSAGNDNFDRWEDRFWAFLPRTLAVVPVGAGQDLSDFRLLPTTGGWSFVSTSPPVFSEASELGYIVLRPERRR